MTQIIQKTEWNDHLRSLENRVKQSDGVAILCHQNADPDATCSAFALHSLLQRLAPKVPTKIVCPEGISGTTKQLLENLGITIPDESLPATYDLAILVDTNNIDQLGAAGAALITSHTPIVVVDHHHPHPDTVKIAAQLIIDESAAAAVETVYRLWQMSGEKLGVVEARAMLAALFVETKHFMLATEATFEVAASFVRFGADPRHLSEMLSTPVSRSERIARLKAAGRSRVSLVGDWIIATSELSSYQSSAARALLAVGAHVAFVAGESKQKTRVNMRATEGFYAKTGVHLARDVSIPIGKKLAGVGGGHATAAGLSVPGVAEEVLKICVDAVRESLGPFNTSK